MLTGMAEELKFHAVVISSAINDFFMVLIINYLEIELQLLHTKRTLF